MIFVAIISFVGGMMTHSALATTPLVVEYDAACVQYTQERRLQKRQPEQIQDKQSVTAQIKTKNNSARQTKGQCMYVGSKRSTKYYPPTCRFAKRIAPENLRCFTSDEDARAKGYVRSRAC